VGSLLLPLPLPLLVRSLGQIKSLQREKKRKIHVGEQPESSERGMSCMAVACWPGGGTAEGAAPRAPHSRRRGRQGFRSGEAGPLHLSKTPLGVCLLAPV